MLNSAIAKGWSEGAAADKANAETVPDPGLDEAQ